MSIYYLGAFPIEGGGVTLKNKYLYDSFKSNGLDIKRIDFNKITRNKNIIEFIKLLIAILNPFNSYCIGISTGKNTRRKFTQCLYYLNRRAMKKSIIMIMGGTAADEIIADPIYKKWMASYKRVYVETPKMKEQLQFAGLKNCDLYPNCRYRPAISRRINYSENDILSCVFFSLIVPEKGVDNILEAAKALPNISFSFYGHIPDSYKNTFFSKISHLTNVIYKGNFKGTTEEVYDELNKYDVLLFPTLYKTEGVPGILVEAKIAGIAEIVSNESHNAELVTNDIDGIVLQQNTSEQLIKAIKLLDLDRKKLHSLKQGSLESASMFYIENYIDKLLHEFS